jgi:Cu/Ag efflux protein CusF
MKAQVVLSGLLISLLAAGSADAQKVSTKSSEMEPCCNITAIDTGNGLITAQTKAGNAFQFKVSDAVLLKSLKLGQGIRADFGAGKVTVNGATPCCSIIRPAEPAGKQVKPAEPANNGNVNPAEPCCAITAINSATGIVTASDAKTGRLFRFEVKDAALLKTLKAGQKVFADFGTSKVRIHGLEPCCGIIGHGVGGNQL